MINNVFSCIFNVVHGPFQKKGKFWFLMLFDIWWTTAQSVMEKSPTWAALMKKSTSSSPFLMPKNGMFFTYKLLQYNSFTNFFFGPTNTVTRERKIQTNIILVSVCFSPQKQQQETTQYIPCYAHLHTTQNKTKEWGSAKKKREWLLFLVLGFFF